jgi:ABC-type nitrate/sulfonate/bicarbonate transport system substrate-binding protein
MHNDRDFLVFASGALAALVMMVSSVAGGDERVAQLSPASGDRRLVVSLGAPLDVTDAGLIVANQSGVFHQAGLRVELRARDSDADVLVAVAAGDADIGLVKAGSFLQARARGVAVVAFAAGLVESPVAFYALSSSKIHTPFDLVGKTIAYRPGSESAMLYEAMLARYEIPRSRVKEVAAPAEPGALLSDAVDLAPLTPSEALALSQSGVRVTALRPADFGVHELGAVYFTTETMLRENPDAVAKFLKALIAGWGLAYDDQSASDALIAGALGLEPTRVRALLTEQRDLLRPLAARYCEFGRGQWRETEDILLSAQRLAEPLDLSAAVNFDVLREAYRRSGALTP